MNGKLTAIEKMKKERHGMNGYLMAIEELALSGAIGLGRCHPSTQRRWVREINAILEHGKYPWRVRKSGGDGIEIDPDWTPKN